MDIVRLAGALALSPDDTVRKQNEQYISEVSYKLNQIKFKSNLMDLFSRKNMKILEKSKLFKNI